MERWWLDGCVSLWIASFNIPENAREKSILRTGERRRRRRYKDPSMAEVKVERRATGKLSHVRSLW